MANVNLNAIYQRLNQGTQYTPASAETFSDWSLEAGDVVKLTKDGKTYTTPVMQSGLKWNGAAIQKIESTGNTQRESLSTLSKTEYNSGGRGSGAYYNSQKGYQLIEESYNEMRAGLLVTASSLSLYVDDNYKQLKSGLDMTSSSASLYVDNRYKQMKAGLDLTSSSASLYVDNRYKQMKAGLDLTSSSASLYVDNRYKQMKAGLDLTSSSLSAYVRDTYKQLKSGLDLTSSSARMYASSADNAAEIVARINEAGEGEIKLDADKVYIGKKKSTTVINGKLEATDFTSESVATLVEKASSIYVKQLGVLSGGVLSSPTIIITGATEASSINVKTALQSNLSAVQITGPTQNVYKLQYKTYGSDQWQDAGTFSRATSLTGTWGGSVPDMLTVKASPQGNEYKVGFRSGGDVQLAIYGDGTPYFADDSKKAMYMPVSVGSVNSGSAPTQRGQADIWVDTSASYSAGHTEGYKVTDSQVSVTNLDIVSTAAGTSAISGRKDCGTKTKPSTSSYLLFNVVVHGHSTGCYIKLS